ncbi:MAG: hypothetical protein ABI083_18645 [Lapillicoccus sp.]
MYRKTSFAVASAAVGATAVLVLSSGPAFAATTYTVKSGTKATGTTTYTAATTGASPQIKFNDVTTGIALSCTKGTAAGSIKLGKSISGVGLGTIASSTWTGCIGPVGLQMTVKQNAPWTINATGTTSATGVTKGTITGVNATVSATAGGCSFNVLGGVKATITANGAAKQTLKIAAAGSTLKISGVAGCFGQLNNGDSVTFAGTYKIAAASGPLSIKNP